MELSRLRNHWFARVLVFPVISFVSAMAAFILNSPDNGFPFLAIAIGCAVAWFASGIPVYYWRLRRSGNAAPARPSDR